MFSWHIHKGITQIFALLTCTTDTIWLENSTWELKGKFTQSLWLHNWRRLQDHERFMLQARIVKPWLRHGLLILSLPFPWWCCITLQASLIYYWYKKRTNVLKAPHTWRGAVQLRHQEGPSQIWLWKSQGSTIYSKRKHVNSVNRNHIHMYTFLQESHSPFYLYLNISKYCLACCHAFERQPLNRIDIEWLSMKGFELDK